jgi:hypothetical protein
LLAYHKYDKGADMLTTGHIHPQWNIEDFKTLAYKYDTHKDSKLLDQYEQLGHSRSNMTLYNYFEPNPMPVSIRDDILNNFPQLTNVSIAVNLFKPGQYLPTHVDLFEKYRSVHGLDKSADVARVIVMLEDSESGQISQACNQTFGEWNAGFWLQWEESDPHAFYNFSMKDRYAVQITGTIS